MVLVTVSVLYLFNQCGPCTLWTNPRWRQRFLASMVHVTEFPQNTFIWRLLNFSNIGGKAKSAKIQVRQYSIFIPLHMHNIGRGSDKKENLMSTWDIFLVRPMKLYIVVSH